METAPKVRQRKMADSNPAQELQQLLEAMARSVVDEPQNITVCTAQGRGFAHFEIRCSKTALSKLESLKRSIQTVIHVAGSARKTRITIKFHEQPVHEAKAPRASGLEPSKELENLVLTMAQSMADRPDEVVAFPGDGDGFSHYDVRCDHKDVGALLGTRGAHVDAMRKLLEAAGKIRNIRASIHVMARDGND